MRKLDRSAERCVGDLLCYLNAPDYIRQSILRSLSGTTHRDNHNNSPSARSRVPLRLSGKVCKPRRSACSVTGPGYCSWQRGRPLSDQVNPYGMVAQLRRSRAWRGCPKPRRWRKRWRSAQALQCGLNRAEGFLVEDAFTASVTQERRPWASRMCPQRWGRTIEEPVHPRAFATRVVISTRRFAWGWLFYRHAGAAAADGEITPLIARIEFTVQAHFDA